jgi:hypothetical protein
LFLVLSFCRHWLGDLAAAEACARRATELHAASFHALVGYTPEEFRERVYAALQRAGLE